jgi:hypothetical protein
MILRTCYPFTGLARPEIPSIAISTQPASNAEDPSRRVHLPGETRPRTNTLAATYVEQNFKTKFESTMQASLLGCIGILVHSFLDFNLQIPANAALFYVLCAIAASGPLQESQRRRVVRRRSLIVEPSPETAAS